MHLTNCECGTSKLINSQGFFPCVGVGSYEQFCVVGKLPDTTTLNVTFNCAY